MAEISQPVTNSTKTNFWSSLSYHSVSDFLAAGLLAANWAYPLYHLASLPSTIPLHYNFKGAVNWSGSKYFMLLFPLAAILVYYKTVHRPVNEKHVLFPLKAPEGTDPEKVSTIAKILNKVRGAINQTALLAVSVILVKGITASASTRATWVRGKAVFWGLSMLFAFAGAQIALRRK